MSKRNPVNYTIENQEYTLRPISEANQWAIDRYLPTKTSPLSDMRDMIATHYITTVSTRGVTLMVGVLAYRPMTPNNPGVWHAYADDSKYITCQPKLLLAFAQMCEFAHNGWLKESVK